MQPREMAIIRATIWRLALLKPAIVVTGLMMAWQAAECGLMRHHGHAMICASLVMANLLAYGLADRTHKLAREALKG